MNEHGMTDSDVIEIQLAHAVDGVRGAYHRARYLAQRIALMTAWGDYLEKLRAERSPDAQEHAKAQPVP